MRKLWQTSKVKMWEESVKLMNSRTQKRGYSKCVHIRTRGRGRGWKIGHRYVRTNAWPQKYVLEYFLCIGLAKYTRALPPARKMLLFPSVIITIIYPMRELEFRNFRYLLAGLSTEALAELYWVITLGVFEKINSIYFQGISLVFSRIRRPSQN